MARTPRASALAATRYRLLIGQIAAEAGRPHRGWQSEVARRLGVDRSLIAKVLSPESTYAIGDEAIRRACDHLGLLRTFFTTPGARRKPKYEKFLDPKRPRLTERRRDPAPHWVDLVGRAPKLSRDLAAKRIDANDLHALALDVLAVPAVQAALRISENKPTKADERRIFAEAPAFIAALKEERNAIRARARKQASR